MAATSLRGEFDMSWGLMKFTSNNYARYEGGRSFITGKFNPATAILVGYWIEPDSSRRCSYQRGGTYYWGRFRFKFDRQLNFLIGSWEYCDKVVTGHGGTTGLRRIAANKGTRFGTGAIFSAPPYGDMTFYSKRAATDSSHYIIGTLNEKSGVFDGTWSMGSGLGSGCAKPGSAGAWKWGRVRFIFDRTRTYFNGTWSYCQADPVSGSWNGKRIQQ